MKSLGWLYLSYVSCAFMVVAAWAVDLIPRRTIREPSFKIQSVVERSHDMQGEDHKFLKIYVITVKADGGGWTIAMDRENRVLFQRYVQDR